MTAAQRRIDALDVSTPVLEARLRAGRLAEYGHWLHDADPDSTVPVFPDLAKGRRAVDPDLLASLNAKFMAPVVWGEQPARLRPAGYSPDCEPEFVDPTVTDVQTGDVL